MGLVRIEKTIRPNHLAGDVSEDVGHEVDGPVTIRCATLRGGTELLERSLPASGQLGPPSGSRVTSLGRSSLAEVPPAARTEAGRKDSRLARRPLDAAWSKST